MAGGIAEKGPSGSHGEAAGPPPGRGLFAGITRNVFVAGLVSLLTDVSTEMIYPILPIFLVTVLGASAVTVGIIEGIGEATASVLKVFSGWMSDRVGRRKPLMLVGYGLSDLSKPFLALSASWPQVLAIRFADRFGKGIRGAPRDALIADSTAKEVRGKAFGFHRGMDTLGAALGPLIAFGLLSLYHEDYRLVFAASAAPGILAVIVLGIALREKRPSSREPVAAAALPWRGFGRQYLVFAGIATLFALGNSSDAFLILRAQDIGLATALVPLAYFGFNIVYSILAMPFGSLSDRVGRRGVIVAGYLIFGGVYLGFALANESWQVWPLFLAYGAYYALTEGVQRAYVADLVPAGLRGSAIGTFNAMVGLAALPASIAGGLLWEQVSHQATFLYAAAFAVLAAVLFLALPSRPARI